MEEAFGEVGGAVVGVVRGQGLWRGVAHGGSHRCGGWVEDMIGIDTGHVDPNERYPKATDNFLLVAGSKL